MTRDHESLYCSIHDFVTAELEGAATEEERRAFAELIRENAETRRLYVAYIQELTDLRWSFSQGPDSQDTEDLIDETDTQAAVPAPPASSLSATTSPNTGRQRTRSYWYSLAMAASLLIGAGWVVIQQFDGDAHQDQASGEQPPRTESAQAESVGWVMNLEDVKWTPDANRYKELAKLPLGETLCFNSGVMKLMLGSGAEVVIEGPANVALKSTKKVFVQEGKLVVRCNSDAIGFEVESPDAKVVDLGTVFGLSVVDDQRTDVAVYDGAVDLSSHGDDNPLARRLTAGEAMHVSRHGLVGRIALVPNDRLLVPRRLDGSGGSRSGLIREVRDNLQDSETAKYYRIVKGGFKEDCQAFVDRAHQWNGLKREGLPPQLVGGDYVMTFNDDKIRRVAIEVDLATPATLYVLMDNRVAIPAWLEGQFVDTGWDVGLDESDDDRPHVKNDVGPGRSIDQVFSVWRRDIPQATTVKLGPIRSSDLDVDPRTIKECAYGIVATKLTSSPPVSVQ